MLDWLETSARETGGSQSIVAIGSRVGSARRAPRSARTGPRPALLVELEAYPGVRDSPYYPACLPRWCEPPSDRRAAISPSGSLIGLEPRYPYAEHALVAANAALTEATR